jgi:hypothetical protein
MIHTLGMKSQKNLKFNLEDKENISQTEIKEKLYEQRSCKNLTFSERRIKPSQ